MNKIIERLRCRRGSSLIECVLSLLIFTLISTLFATMLGTAATLLRQTTALDAAVNEAGNAAEFATGTAGDEDATLRFMSGGAQAAVASVRLTRIDAPIADGAPGAGTNVTLWRIAPAPPPVPPAPPVEP